MKTFGIVCEYNPFHEGHAYHIEQTRAKFGATHILCVMSGTLVQRGDIAIFDKWKRAQSAIQGGADLVIELPSAKSLASAEKFATNAVSLLQKTGVADGISFGSECGDIEKLKLTAAVSKTEKFAKNFRMYLDLGRPYHHAYADALKDAGADGTVLSLANNLLGIEYIKAADRLGFNCEFATVKRAGALHDSLETNAPFPSSTARRAEIIEGHAVEGATIHSLHCHEEAVLALLRNPTIDFSKLADVSEGIDNRLKKAIESSISVTEILEKVKTKRYTMSRVRRLLISACFGLTQELAEEEQNYIRILAFNRKGKELIKAMKKTAQVPIITDVLGCYSSVEKLPNLLRFECKVSDLYGCFGQIVERCGSEFLNSPVFFDPDVL